MKHSKEKLKARSFRMEYKANSRHSGYVNDMVKINGADDVAAICAELTDKLQEHFYVLHLNSSSKLIEKQLVSLGTLNQTIVHPREVFRQAIINSAAAIIVVHNHPSGMLEASIEDKKVTKRLKECGALIGIELLDHVIVSREGHTSLREIGLL